MSNINLLPDDLRRKEEKEIGRSARKPKIFEIDLSQPRRAKPLDSGQRAPKKSFWSIFSKSSKTKLSQPKEQESYKNALPSVDLLSSAKKPSRDHQPKIITPKEKHQSGRWSKIFGSPRMPIKPLSETNQNIFTPSKEFKIRETVSKTPKTSWFSAKEPKIKAIKPIKIAAEKILEPKVKIDLAKNRADFKAKNRLEKKAFRQKNEDGWGRIISSMFVSKKKARGLSEAVVIDGDKEIQKIKPAKPIKEKIEKKSPSAKTKKRFNINLIPEELIYHEQINLRMQIIALVLAVVFPALVVYGAYRLISVYQEQVNGQIQQKQAEIKDLGEVAAGYQKIKQKNIVLQQKLMAVKGALDEHIYWTNFFNLLEKYTLDSVYYTDFSADTAGEFTLPAIATGSSVAASYDEAAKQITALRQAVDFIKEARVDKVSLHSTGAGGIAGVEFELKLKLVDNIFKNIKK